MKMQSPKKQKKQKNKNKKKHERIIGWTVTFSSVTTSPSWYLRV